MKLSGNLEGLTRVETRELERLFKRRISSEEIISLDLARELIEQSNALERIVALLIDRLGHIREVIIGRKNIVYLPDLGRYRVGTGRLRGLRLIVPDLSKQREGESGATISDDLYTDLEKLRLDMVVTVRAAGNRTAVTYAHILPRGSASDTSARPVRTEKVKDLGLLDVHAAEFIAGLEQEIIAAHTLKRIGNRPRAVLVGVYNKGFQGATSSLAELRELANSAGVEVVDQIAQRRIPDPKTFLGKGKLEELNLHCLRLDAEMLVFDTELKPSQWRAVTNASELKVVDRSMLILDIFAQRATSSDGKLQVELAQLKYNLPKLVEKDAGLSRLSGGIGGRGPGETKLEVGRRVIRDRIAELERRVQKLSRERTLRRQKRSETGFPVVGDPGIYERRQIDVI
jgi:GTP-binding protein HflX